MQSTNKKTIEVNTSENGFREKFEKFTLLAKLGFPKSHFDQPALACLHAGAAYHSVAILSDVVKAYTDSVSSPVEQVDFAHMISSCCENLDPRQLALSYYSQAVTFQPDLAEAKYNLAKIHADLGDNSKAISLLISVIDLAPHPNHQPHIDLKANALWTCGELYEKESHLDAALSNYQAAVKRQPNFGVHHKKYANLLRQKGLYQDALHEYDKLMEYSHRYFPEFCLPPLISQQQTKSQETSPYLEIIMTLPKKDHIVFHNGQYFLVPQNQIPITAEQLDQIPSEEIDFSTYVIHDNKGTKISRLINNLAGAIGRRKKVQRSTAIPNLIQQG